MKTEPKRNIKGYNWIEDISSKMLIGLVSANDLLIQILNSNYAKFGISETKFNALFLLYKSKEEGMLLSELGEEMVVTRANITGLIDRLEKDELVRRLSHPTDRRSKIAKITSKGIQLIENIIPVHIELNQKLTALLTVKEKETMINLLDKFYEGLAAME